jgi:1-acyl-sn-glycerol-3-phosphate acyltransferase
MARRVVDLRPTEGGDETAAQPRRRAPRRKRAAAGAPDAFSERLRALEVELEEALTRAGARIDADMTTRARQTIEELVAFYADFSRALVSGGLEGAFIRLRMIGTSDRVDDFGYDAELHARVAPLLRFLYERWWRVELAGVENVPRTGRVLLVANHAGGFLPYDALMLAHALREHHPGGGRSARPLVEDPVYHFPVTGPLLARIGAVRASGDNAERLLERDQAVIAFPEGIKGLGKYYGERYRLQRFARGGFAALAMRCRAPLVPVAIVGAEEIHPILAKWQWLARLLDVPYFPVTPTFPWLGLAGLVPLPTKWRIVFGPAIDLAAEYGSDVHDDDLVVNRVKEQIRDRIQRMLIDALRERDSVFTG